MTSQLFVRLNTAVLGSLVILSMGALPYESMAAEIIPAVNAAVFAPESVGPSTYTLGAGDVVRIDIFRMPDYSGESQVLVDGTLNLPLIGKVGVSGLSLEAAAAAVSRQYAQYLKRPVTTVSLVSRRPLQVGIAGEVSRPGSYTVEQGNTQFSRLSQLIETAGGVTQSADLSQVEVRRVAADDQQIVVVDLWEVIETGNLNQDLVLRDGDSIFIPTTLVPLENAALLADASFSSDVNQPINVAIIGEVYRPGPYTLRSGAARENGGTTSSASGGTPTTVTRAIQVAGGIKPQANVRKVQVVRPTRSGASQVFEVDLWKLLEAGDLKQDAILQEGDTVFVPLATEVTPQETGQLAAASFSPDTIQVNVVGEVEDAGTVQLQPNTPLSQAILAAGGFNRRASRGTAELVRINEDGTVSRTEIAVDFAQGLSEENNPLLRNNDVVIVNRSGLAVASDVIGTVVSPFAGFFRFLNLF